MLHPNNLTRIDLWLITKYYRVPSIFHEIKKTEAWMRLDLGFPGVYINQMDIIKSMVLFLCACHISEDPETCPHRYTPAWQHVSLRGRCPHISVQQASVNWTVGPRTSLTSLVSAEFETKKLEMFSEVMFKKNDISQWNKTESEEFDPMSCFFCFTWLDV